MTTMKDATNARRRVNAVIFRALIVFSAVITLGGCATGPQPAAVIAPVAAAPAGGWILDRLYLGRGIPRGGEVSDEAWTTFLADVVTPRFPSGFTALAGNGQWREESGAIARERSFVLEILHHDDAVAENAVREIAAEYKRRFAQEAVLRVREHVDASF
jgi:hypothetical protein